MKAIFAHDHVFKRDINDKLYTSGSFNNVVWKRYLKYFDHLTILARQENIKIKETNKKYNDFNLSNTSLIPLPNLSGPFAKFKNSKQVKGEIKKELLEADVLVVRLPSEIGKLAIEVARELNKPYMTEVVACVWDALWNYGSLQGKIYAPLALYSMKKKVKNSPYTIYVTNQFLQKRYPSAGKTINISNVELEKIEEKALNNRLAKIENSKQLFKIGMIGSLKNNIKGLETALNAMKILNENNIDFEFQILGDGEEQSWLEMAKKLGVINKIKFCGVLPGGDPVLHWLDTLDLYIQPSYQEGLPRAVIEAMSRGCPVIGSTAGGIPELVDEDCLHKPGDYIKLSKLIIDVMFNLDKAMFLSKQNFEEAKNYKKEYLEEKRELFWKEFLEEN